MAGEAAAPAAPAAPNAPSGAAADGGGTVPQIDARAPAGTLPKGWAPKRGAAVEPNAPAEGAERQQAPSRAQQIATGTPPKGATPTGKPPTQPQRAPVPPPKAPPQPKPAEQGAAPESVMTTITLDDGTELEVDIGEQVRAAIASTRRKIKANGAERELSVEEAYQLAPLAEHARAKAYEATEAKKFAAKQKAQVEQLGAALRDPRQAPAILRKLLGEQQYQTMIENDLAAIFAREKMPPQERAALEARERAEAEYAQRGRSLEERERALEQRTKQEQEQRTATQAQQLQQQYARDFPIHLRQAGAPVTPRTIAMLAEAKLDAMRAGLPHDDAALARQVAQEMRDIATHYGNELQPEQLSEALPEAARRLREADVARARAAPGGRAPVTRAKPREMPAEIRTSNDQRRFLREQDKKAQAAWLRTRGGQ